VLDDGRRTLVFDRAGAMQISLDLRPATPDQHGALLQEIGRGLAAEHPSAEFLELMIGDLPCLAVRNLPVNGQLLQQAYIARASTHASLALVCRVTAGDDTMSTAMDAAELLLTSYGLSPAQDASVEASVDADAIAGTDAHAEADAPALRTPQDDAAAIDREFAGLPAWWREAVLLERQDRLDEAESVIVAALDHLGRHASLASLYEGRMHRLRDAGDAAGAEAARLKAIDWWYSYAAGATSGGEGAALSYERDQHVAALGGR
jgi:hypothetical protein